MRTLKGMLLLLVLLSACDGDGGSNPGSPPVPELRNESSCVGSLAGGGTQVSSSIALCPACSIENMEQAADGVRDSYASIAFTPIGGSAALKATAQQGIVFPAGNDAGALVLFPSSLSLSAVESLRIKTYLGGAEQEESGATTSIASGSVLGGSAGAFFTFKTAKPFDAVELAITLGGSTRIEDIRIYEFCSRL